MVRTNTLVGIVLMCDEELGEYGEPTFHVRLGRVLDYEGKKMVWPSLFDRAFPG